MKTKNIFGTLTLLIIIFASVACSKEEPIEEPMDPDPVECSTDDVTYENTIKTILSGCTASSCHGASTSRSMANYDDAKAYAGLGRILGALRREAGFNPMPQGGAKLSDCKIDQVAAWIADGFPE